MLIITPPKNNKKLIVKILIVVGILALSIDSYVKCYKNGKCYRYNYSYARSAAAHHHSSSCFNYYSQIQLYNGNRTTISQVKIGDKILGWDKENNIKELEIEELKTHYGNFQLYTLALLRDDRIIVVYNYITGYHPIKLNNNGWCSIEGIPSDSYYKNYNIKLCTLNDIIYYNNKEYKIIKINKGIVVNKVYDIETIGDYNSFPVQFVRVSD